MAVAESQKATGSEKPEIKVTRIGGGAGVLASNTQEIEDAFNPFYLNRSNQLVGHILRPLGACRVHHRFLTMIDTEFDKTCGAEK